MTIVMRGAPAWILRTIAPGGGSTNDNRPSSRPDPRCSRPVLPVAGAQSGGGDGQADVGPASAHPGHRPGRRGGHPALGQAGRPHTAGARKGRPRADLPRSEGITAMAEKKKIVYLQTSGIETPERLYAPFILATTAAAMGQEPIVYFF